MKAFLLYTWLRIALFIGVGGVLYLLGMRGLLLAAAALLVSGLLSFTLLSGARDQMSAALAARKAGLDAKLAARTAAEDAANDALRESQDARLAGAEPLAGEPKLLDHQDGVGELAVGEPGPVASPAAEAPAGTPVERVDEGSAPPTPPPGETGTPLEPGPLPAPDAAAAAEPSEPEAPDSAPAV